MTFGEKLKKLRTDTGLTQEELAEKLYVTRTAISKWESDRGYPSIDSLKAISKFFSVTVDTLLSSEEVLSIAEEDNKEKDKRRLTLVYSLLDISVVLLLFLPLFAEGTQSVSLIFLAGVSGYLRITYIALVALTVLLGLLSVALRRFVLKWTVALSLSLGLISVLLFIVSSQPYAAVFAFALLVIKALMLPKN